MVADFGGLLEALADDPISLLATGRPQNESALHLFERSLVERVDLEGLSLADIGVMGERLFGGGGESSTIALLERATLGNPLALRSALRGALREETIERDANGGWKADERFEQVVLRGATSIAEGLAAHLAREERAGAARLSPLGEVFSREGAATLLGDEAATMIKQLLYKGILIHSQVSAALLPGCQRSSSGLLTFAHTLVHHTLLDEVELAPEDFTHLLLKCLPLYSIFPFEKMASGPACPWSNEDLYAIVDRTLSMANELDGTSEWNLAVRLIEAMLTVVKRSESSAEGKREATMRLLDGYLYVHRDHQQATYVETLERYQQMAINAIESSPEESSGWLHRIKSLAHAYHVSVLNDGLGGTPEEVKETIDQLTALRPELRLTQGYIHFLEWRIEHESNRGGWDPLREIERQIEELADSGEGEESVRKNFSRQLRTNFLTLVDTSEEYRKRKEQIRETDEEFGVEGLSRTSWLLLKTRFYGMTGDFKRQIELQNEALTSATKRGRTYAAQSLVESIAKCRLALGESPEQIEQGLRKDGKLDLDPITVHNLAFVGQLCGHREWSITFYDEHFRAPSNPTPLPHLLALWREDRASAWAQLGPHPMVQPIFEPTALLLEGSDSDRSALTDWIEQVVDAEVITLRHIYLLEIASRLLELAGDRLHGSAELMRRAATSMIAWAEERELWTIMVESTRRFGDLLGAEKCAEVERSANQLRLDSRHLITEAASGERSRIKLSMFGAIEIVTDPASDPQRPRGERLKTLLGVMVAGQLLGRPLDRDEFLAVASGQGVASRQARDVVNKTVSRLREFIGEKDAIRTDGAVPELDLEQMEVDLIDAHQALRRSSDALRSKSLLRAREEFERTLALWKGEVPFPALYSELFESLRDEFEAEVRSTGLQIARQITDLGDDEGVESLLRTLDAYIPEDEEVLQLRVASLKRTGRKSEAARISLQLEGLSEVG